MLVHKEIRGNDDKQILVTYWDQNMKFSGSTGFSTYNVGSSNVIDRLPSLSPFESGSLSEITSSFALPENTRMQEFPSSDDHPVEKNLKGKKRKKSSECGDQSVEVEKQNDVPTKITNSSLQKDEKKQKNGVEASVKENGDAPKEDFVHVRAKRGQATNSHSFAERVRREKISERLKLLQDLVPGCNKITGKAVMLDEIINYVQSLQKQVEFLSMKLATVNPDFNLDIKQLLSKENAHSRHGSSPFLGYSHPQLQPSGMVIPTSQNSRDFLRIANNHQISPMAQVSNPWDNEFQNAVQMGLIPNLPNEGMDLNGNG